MAKKKSTKKKKKRSRSAVGKSSRGKGQRGERKAAKALEGWWGSEFARTPSSGGFRTKKFRDEWNAASDLVTSDETFPFAVEVKNCEGWHLEQLLTAPKCDLYDWWDQAVREAPLGKIPLLMFTRNHQPFFVVMRARHWRPDVVPAPLLSIFIDGKEVCIMKADTLFETHKEDWKDWIDE